MEHHQLVSRHLKIHSLTCPAFITSYWEVLEEEKDSHSVDLDNKFKFREIVDLMDIMIKERF